MSRSKHMVASMCSISLGCVVCLILRDCATGEEVWAMGLHDVLANEGNEYQGHAILQAMKETSLDGASGAVSLGGC